MVVEAENVKKRRKKPFLTTQKVAGVAEGVGGVESLATWAPGPRQGRARIAAKFC
ncbi:hypothetical protein DmGdi_31900 [Gluconobacter sp. Gdi]|nr:hypothetical protein DmGdi_31900 [Gluconobacter sp. Gdi]